VSITKSIDWHAWPNFRYKTLSLLMMGSIACVDYHTAGEPFRIVTSQISPPPGATVLERRENAHGEPWDSIRRMLCHEPRGHADMYGCFVVPPNDSGAHIGVLFWHKDGYSTACGHGSIALGAWAAHSGLVHPEPNGETDVFIDAPSGRVTARLLCKDGIVQSVAFRNVPSYVLAHDIAVSTSHGDARIILAYGGAIYAAVPAAALGLSVTRDRLPALIDVARQIKSQINEAGLASHPTDDRLSGLYGTVFYDDLGSSNRVMRQRNVTIFADGEVDRSPCGSGTAARIAQLVAEQALDVGDEFIHDSIIGTTFRARAIDRVEVHGRPGVVSEIYGMAYRTGHHTFCVDPSDPLAAGFVLR
jgi:proline racemase